MTTISIKLGKRVQEFLIEQTISGVTITNPEGNGIVLNMYKSKHSGWCIEYRVREIAFFEDELFDIAVKVAKKNKW